MTTKRTRKLIKSTKEDISENRKKKKVEANENLKEDETIPRNTTMPSTYSFPEIEKGSIKFVSYNVNSINAALKKGLKEYIEAENADIVCLQETKLNEPNYTLFPKKMYPYQYFSCCTLKKGYAGSLVLSKIAPINVTYGIGWKHSEISKEGRIITLEFETLFLVAAYVPNAGQKLERLALRQQWDKEMKRYLQTLQVTKPVVWCGDLNVSHQPEDLARPDTNHRTAGFTDEERQGFSDILSADPHRTLDIYRRLYPNSSRDCYTYFSYRFSCRSKNIGWRLDYFVLSERLLNQVKDVLIRRECYGASDHLPIVLLLKYIQL